MPTLAQQYRINGIIDTSVSVFENMEQLALSSSVWTTYDIHAGRWSVIINRAGASTRSFDDSNIVGAIDVSASGLTDYYNAVKVTFPREDLNDQVDFVLARTPEFQRLPNEADNILEISLPLVNDPVQALNIGAIELKQSRVNQVVTFVTDYSAIDVNAGDIIDITSSALAWTNRLFRVVTMRERDDTGASIAIEITALEYDPNVYVNDLVREDRSTQNEIVTIGGIATPAAPTVEGIQRDARPRLIVTATTPAGLVAAIEFWMSSDGTTFSLYGTERPSGGGVYPSGTSVVLDIGNFPPGPVYARVRAVNSRTSSSFSATTQGVFTVEGLPGGAPTFDFDQFQIPDVITPDVKIEDGLGNLAATLGIIELLKLLDDLMSLGDTGIGGIFDKVFDLFKDDTGVDILGDAGNIANGNGAYQVVAVNNSGNIVSIPGAVGNQTITMANGSGISLAGNAVTRTVTVSSNVLLNSGLVLNGAGPYNYDTIEGSVANIVNNVSRIAIIAEWNSGDSGNVAQVDPTRRFFIDVYKNGNLLISGSTDHATNGLATSLVDSDVYDDLNLHSTVPASFAPGDTIQLKFILQSEESDGAHLGWTVFDATGVV